MSNEKVMIIYLRVGLVKTMWSQYFLKLYEPFEGSINVKVDSSNYAAKADLKNTKGIDTSKLAAKSN